MDSAEESYFNGDEDEDAASESLPLDEPNQQRAFALLKRRRSLDEEGEGDDGFSQLSQRSPLSKGTLFRLFLLTEQP